MAASVNCPPPVHPGPNTGVPHAHPSSGTQNFGQQDPRLLGTSQDPGASSHPQHPTTARPILYVPAPHPPPFLQFQWPMPLSYNPFTGFPGMGYGMVMPSFPPPPYMEAPAYILPQPYIQPVTYRHLVHPRVHTRSASYQNPDQIRRIRPPHTVPVRDTVNSAVQTESPQNGLADYSDDSSASSVSGHGTTPNAPPPSTITSQRRGSTELENSSLPRSDAKDLQGDLACANGKSFNNLHPTGATIVQSSTRTVETQRSCKNSIGQEDVPHYRNGHCNTLSVSSPDRLVPVCSSSQQKDEVVKKRRVSLPDILMLKMTDHMLPQDDHQLLTNEPKGDHERSLYYVPSEIKNGPMVACSADNDTGNILKSKDTETLLEILKPPSALHEVLSESRGENELAELLLSHNKSDHLSDNTQENVNETNPQGDTTEMIPFDISLNSSQMKLKYNESVWSVESVGPFMPPKELLLQKGSCQIRKMNESVWSVESVAPFIPPKELLLQKGSCQIRKMNESVWSVESVAPFIPNEWLLQKGTFEPEMIINTTEAVNGQLSTLNDHPAIHSGKKHQNTSRRLSFSDSVPSSLISSTPVVKPSKMPEIGDQVASEIRGPKQGQCESVGPSAADHLVSLTCVPNKVIGSLQTEVDDKNGSSEPEADRSPNQEYFIVNEQQEKRALSPEQEETHHSKSVAGEKTSPMGQKIPQNGVNPAAEDRAHEDKEVNQVRNEQPCVSTADQRTAEVSPSKAQLVDCGVQCTELQCPCEELKSSMGPNRTQPFCKDMKNGRKTEGFVTQKYPRRNGQWRKRGQEKHSGQQEAGFSGKPGKSKGGHVSNPRPQT